METVDLTPVPVVDNHCHGVMRDQAFEDITAYRRAFTESADPGMPRDHLATTALYRRLIRTLATFLDCGPRLLAEHDSLAGTEEALASALDDVRGRGYVALKSIAAYRTGLDVREWPREEAEGSFREYKRAAEAGAPRLVHKPLLDSLLQVAFAQAARQEVPLQFHVGYGDADTDLLLGNPLYLRRVLQRPDYRGMPLVLLHECYPYTRQGGYLAAVYENAYLDLSYGIPLLSYGEMLSFTRAALGVAPASKLVYSSDGIGVPELHWISAIDGRRAIGQALGEMVHHGELTLPEAEAAGESLLRGNATRLYKLHPDKRSPKG